MALTFNSGGIALPSNHPTGKSGGFGGVGGPVSIIGHPIQNPGTTVSGRAVFSMPGVSAPGAKRINNGSGVLTGGSTNPPISLPFGR